MPFYTADLGNDFVDGDIPLDELGLVREVDHIHDIHRFGGFFALIALDALNQDLIALP